MGIFRLKRKTFSTKKDDREVVPKEMVEKAKKEGVIQKVGDKWRIISLKANPPRYWSSEYDSKASAEAGLRGYFMSKR